MVKWQVAPVAPIDRDFGENHVAIMTQFTLVYWKDDRWFVGQLKELPNVFTQGETLEELKENIRDCYELILEDELHDVPEEREELTIAL